jgi:hypothetical protein
VTSANVGLFRQTAIDDARADERRLETLRPANAEVDRRGGIRRTVEANENAA